MTMLRNIDLPECIIFYGIDTIVTPNENKYNIKKGVTRLLNECQEVDTAAILLSERLHIDEMKDIASNAVNDENESGLLMEYVNNGVLHLRSSLDQTPSSSLLYTNNLNVSDGEDEEEVEEDPKYLYYNLGPIGISPNPASVIDALNSVTIQPRGFGGSSGFGTQKQDPARSPIPKHTVAFVSGLSDDGNDSNEETTTAISRGRCTACRLAGMRVLYIEDLGMGTCTAEDLADGIVETLGDENVDWDVVTLDGVSTPGNYWLNPPNPRDDEGNRVNVEEVVEFFRKERRSNVVEATDNEVEEGSGGGFDSIHDEMDEEEMARILSDIDGL